MLTLLARDAPYGPTSVNWLLDSAAETRETITVVTDELVAHGYLEPGDDPDIFRSFYPAGNAPCPHPTSRVTAMTENCRQISRI